MKGCWGPPVLCGDGHLLLLPSQDYLPLLKPFFAFTPCHTYWPSCWWTQLNYLHWTRNWFPFDCQHCHLVGRRDFFPPYLNVGPGGKLYLNYKACEWHAVEQTSSSKSTAQITPPQLLVLEKKHNVNVIDSETIYLQQHKLTVVSYPWTEKIPWNGRRKPQI